MARKIAISIVAFANTKGGKLLIGVKDNGNIIGIKTEEEYYMLDLAASIYCKPEVKLNYTKWSIEGKTILEADIPVGKEKPYFAKNEEGKWLAYFRQEDQNHLANIIQLKVWKNENTNRSVLLKYSSNENLLLTFLRQNTVITLKEFISLAKINRRTAVNIISKMVIFKIIDVIYDDGNYSYSLHQEDKNEV